MVWKPTRSEGDTITPTDWNEFTQCLLNVSGNLYKWSPADYVITKAGSTYYSIKSRDGTIASQSTSPADVLNYTFGLCGRGKTVNVDWQKGSGSVHLLTDIQLDKTISGSWNTQFDLGGHTIYVNGNFHGLKMWGGFNVHNGRMTYQASPVHVGAKTALIWFYGSAANYGGTWNGPGVVHDMMLKGQADDNGEQNHPTWFSGTAIRMETQCIGEHDELLTSCFYNIYFRNLSYGFYMHASSNNAINAAYGNMLYFNRCRVGFWLSGNESNGGSVNDLNGNMFSNVVLQTEDDPPTYRHIYIGPHTEENYFHCMIWDYLGTPNPLVEFADGDPASRCNVVVTDMPTTSTYIVDNGTNNLIESWNRYSSKEKRFVRTLVSCNTITCGKITAAGSVDPPCVLYDYQTRDNIVNRFIAEVPEGKRNGAMMFFNGETQKLEVYLPCSNSFTDLLGNQLS